MLTKIMAKPIKIRTCNITVSLDVNGPDDHPSPAAVFLWRRVPKLHLATDNELVRNILLALFSSLAKVEAQKISERTKAGMARAKAKGIKIGRPKLGIEMRNQIVRRAAKGEGATPSRKRSASTGIQRSSICRRNHCEMNSPDEGMLLGVKRT
jgi:hypothetical protein